MIYFDEVPAAAVDDASGMVDSLVDPASLIGSGLERHIVLREKTGPQACCSVWTDHTLLHDGFPAGVIGHYEARSARAGRLILDHACRALARAGLQFAVGPMNGNTWRRYRLVIEGCEEPAFFLEPYNPPDYPRHFEQAGFVVIARYCSALSADLSSAGRLTPGKLVQERGIRFRQVDPGRYEMELRRVHALCLRAFARSVCFTPISAEAFLDLYLPLCRAIDPRFITLAEADAQVVGFMFGVPDLCEVTRHGHIRTVLAKSFAVQPELCGLGIGRLLFDRLRWQAREAGMERVILCLMHESNRSMTIAARCCSPMRRYALYGKNLRQLRDRFTAEREG
jgi:GNAT superfamily N-acetyltransferase